jgi:hypothetical protein
MIYSYNLTDSNKLSVSISGCIKLCRMILYIWSNLKLNFVQMLVTPTKL